MIETTGVTLKEPRADAALDRPSGDAHGSFARISKTEAELRRRTAELTAFVETSSLGLHWVGPDGAILWANRAEMDLLGYPAEEYIGHNITEFHADDDTIQDILARLKRGERICNYEARLKCKDGSVRHVLIDSSVLREEGRFVHTQCFTRDVTEQKRNIERIRLYKEIFHASKDGVAVIAPDGTYLEQNDAHRALLGFSDEEIVGKTPAVHLGEKKFLEIAETLGRDGRWRGEVISQPKSGAPMHIELSAFSVKNDQGKLLCHVGIKRDVTERKQAEQALARRAHEQSALYKFTDALHRATSLAEIYTVALDAILNALGCQRASILIFDEAELMRFVGWRGLSDEYRKAVEGHSPWKRDAKDPKPICIDDIAVADIPDSLKETVKGEGIGALAFIPLVVDGKLAGKFMTYYDAPHAFTDDELNLSLTIARQLAFGIAQKRAGEILERTVVERTAQLRDTVAELEAFSYSIAHDMRAPLRAMASFSRVLDDDFAAKLGEEGRNYTHRIAAAAERLDRLIQDVLDYSKISRGEMPMEPVDVELLARGIVDSYSNLQERGATIMIQSQMPRVIGNPAALTQCLSNLLSNAVKFIAPGVKPMIRVWGEANGETIRICVEDNGIGISDDGQKKIFGMFQRLNPATEFEGTGIGLTIVRKAVERMGGRLGVESKLGVGSRFWIELAAAH
jgi:PAS domain S-box-containing protein